MKKNKILLSVFFLLFSLFLFTSFSTGPPTGLTGAPGDGTCNSCHFGATQTGSVNITGIVDVDNPVLPNKTYNVTISITLGSGLSTRAGFQFVALDGNTAGSSSTGTFSNLGTNVGTSTSGGRTYTQHSGGENTYVSNTVTYTFDWTSPSSSTNNISFYATGNIADGFGAGGDLIVFDSDQNIILPVELTFFDVKDSGDNKAILRWETATELNSDYFKVQRSENSRDFETIGRVDAVGNTEFTQNYEFIDNEPFLNKNSFYRLLQLDVDGQFTYSPVKAVQVKNFDEQLLNVFPNPVKKENCLFVDFFSKTAIPNAKVLIYDLYGRMVYEDQITINGVEKGYNKYVIDINSFSTGQYILKINNAGSNLTTKSFIVIE